MMSSSTLYDSHTKYKLMLLKTAHLLALTSVAKATTANAIQPRKLAKSSKEAKGTKSTKGSGEPNDAPNGDSTPDNGPPEGSSYTYKMGGWVGDDSWGVEIPFANLDFLNYGYLTCIQTLKNGSCSQPGIRSASQGPPQGTNGAKCVKFTIGGDGCSTSGWNYDYVVNSVKQYGWCGVDVDNECSMTASQMSAQFQAANSGGVTSMFSVLGPDQLNGLTVSPEYYATLTFWGDEWCSDTNPAPNCSPWSGSGGYEKQIPIFIQGVLSHGVPSRSVLLGLHAKGINSATIDFWCQQIIDNSLGGVMISFINDMDPTLFQQLQTCLNSSPPAPSDCKVSSVELFVYNSPAHPTHDDTQLSCINSIFSHTPSSLVIPAGRLRRINVDAEMIGLPRSGRTRPVALQ
jgi:hypothetical protein